MSLVLCADIGSTFTKVCLVQTDPPGLHGQAAAPTTINDVRQGFDAAVQALGPAAGQAGLTLVSSSAAGGLRIAVIGLVPELTLRAGRLAALGAGGRVTAAFSYRLTDADMTALMTVPPDLVLLTGGIDGGNSAYLLHNARRLAAWEADVPIVIAANRAAYDELRTIFGQRPEVHCTANVMPEFNRIDLAPVQGLVRRLFLERIVRAKGLDRLAAGAVMLMPTPEAVFKAVQLLAEGTDGVAVCDMGGATTDVFSCAAPAAGGNDVVFKGLPEPYAKRTVEADIGLRHSLTALADQVDLDAIARQTGTDCSAVDAWIARASGDPAGLPADDAEEAIESALAGIGCGLAVERHAGRREEVFTPQGRVTVLTGKDLTAVPLLIGTGGGICRRRNPAAVLQAVIDRPAPGALMPLAPRLGLDRDYIMWAMGLLAEREPEAARTILGRAIVPLLLDEGEME